MARGEDAAVAPSQGAVDEGRAILDALPVLVARIGPDGRYRFANSSYETWFGRRPSEVVGRTAAEVVGDEAYASVRPYVE